MRNLRTLEELQIRVLKLQFDGLAPKTADEENAALLPMDESRFREFYDETSRPLLRYLTAVTRNPDFARDLLQEAYCRFLTARLPAMAEHQMRGYLFRIAANLIRDRWRRAREESSSDDCVELAAPPSHLERNLSVRQAFDRLKARERQLLWLAYVEGSNHQEIAERTGLRPGSIRLLLFRARHRMAKLIAKRSPTPDSETPQ